MTERRDTAEIIAGLVLPRSANLVYGGRDFRALTAEDAAFAMAGLTRRESLIVRAVWLSDGAAFRDLELLTWMTVVESVVVPQRWHERVKERGHFYWRRMALLALCELIWPRCCPACKGSGRVRDDELVLVRCPLCDGTPWHGYGRRRRARIVGMAHEAWRRWEGRYIEHVRPIPGAWLQSAEMYISPRLRRSRGLTAAPN